MGTGAPQPHFDGQERRVAEAGQGDMATHTGTVPLPQLAHALKTESPTVLLEPNRSHYYPYGLLVPHADRQILNHLGVWRNQGRGHSPERG